MSSLNAKDVLALFEQEADFPHLNTQILEEYLSETQNPDLDRVKRIIRQILTTTPGISPSPEQWPISSSPEGWPISPSAEEWLRAIKDFVEDRWKGSGDNATFIPSGPGTEWITVNPSSGSPQQPPPGVPVVTVGGGQRIPLDYPGLSRTFRGPKAYFAEAESIDTKIWKVTSGGEVRFELLGQASGSNAWDIVYDDFKLSSTSQPHDRHFGPKENPSGKWALKVTALEVKSSCEASPFEVELKK